MEVAAVSLVISDGLDKFVGVLVQVFLMQVAVSWVARVVSWIARAVSWVDLIISSLSRMVSSPSWFAETVALVGMMVPSVAVSD